MCVFGEHCVKHREIVSTGSWQYVPDSTVAVYWLQGQSMDPSRQDKKNVFYNTEMNKLPCRQVPTTLDQFHHLTLADKERYERLFREIDINGNGFIDFNDLVQTLERKGIKATHDNIQVSLLHFQVHLSISISSVSNFFLAFSSTGSAF